MFDGLFGHQLLLLVPLHGRHGADPHDADHGLLGDVGLLHLLFGVGDDLGGGVVSHKRRSHKKGGNGDRCK